MFNNSLLAKLIVYECTENFLICPHTFAVKLKLKQHSCCPYSSLKCKFILTAYLSNKILPFISEYFDVKSSEICLLYVLQRQRQNRIASSYLLQLWN